MKTHIKATFHKYYHGDYWTLRTEKMTVFQLTPINIKLSVESKEVITCMGSMSVEGNCKIDLQNGEHEEIIRPRVYWFMPCVFEETNIPNEFMLHELPESIINQILAFIRK